MKLKQSHKGEDSISTSSMADIAFLLIIFFMVTTVFSAKKGMDLQLPDKESEIRIERDKAIVIEIESSEGLRVNNDLVKISSLKDHMTGQLALNPEKYVIIKAHEDVYFERLIDVLDELKQANVKNVAIPGEEELKEWQP